MITTTAFMLGMVCGWVAWDNWPWVVEWWGYLRNCDVPPERGQIWRIGQLTTYVCGFDEEHQVVSVSLINPILVRGGPTPMVEHPIGEWELILRMRHGRLLPERWTS